MIKSLFHKILHVASQIENRFDHWKFRFMRRWKDNTPITILPYIGYGTPDLIRLRGRVLEDHRVQRASENDSMLDNLRNIFYRLNSNEIPHAQIRARYGDYEQLVTADEEGYFQIEFQFETAQALPVGWQDVLLHYDDGVRQAEAVGRVVSCSVDAQYGVISDFDDTVIRSEVINWLKLAGNTFLKNAHTRRSFHGVAEFYEALQQGIEPNAVNPLYYVSNSPYNLYDMIEHFFEVRRIPQGPIFLRDMGLTENYFVASKKHKPRQIKRLLAIHPELPFILIGDSGEHDAKIYLKVVEDHPGRVETIYIRDVEPHRFQTRRDLRVQQYVQRAQELGCELLLVPDTLTAARHALQKGYITAEQFARIEAVQQA